MLFDMPYWSMGYRFAGALGLGASILTSFNRSMASESNFYQLRKMNTEITGEYLKMINDFNQYAMNSNVVWMEAEALRGATSIDKHLSANRIEYHNILTDFSTMYGKAINIVTKYQAKFVEEQSRYHAEDKRLFADVAFGMGAM